jgi:hypothetical protein
MAITVTHPKVSAIPDDPVSVAAGEVVPSDWNANHTVVVDGLDNVPIGTGGASTGDFTTLSASSTVSGAGFSTYLASPPAIGGSTPSTGNFTTLDATTLEVTNLRARDGTSAGSIANTTGIVTLASSVLTTTDINGGTIDGASIGAFSASTGAFTTLSASSTVSGTGFSTYLASPPAIGGTAAAAGTFTNLFSSGQSAFGGTSSVADTRLALTNALPSSGANSKAVYANVTIPSTSTGQTIGFFSRITTAAASFTANQLIHYLTATPTLGAGSAITTQFGYYAEGLTGATTNYGFYSNIAASGSARWNFYANGTAPNYFAGPLGIGGTTTGDPLRIAGTINHAAFSNAQTIEATIGSSVTSGFRGVMSRPITQAATFTLGQLIHFYANPQTKGAGSTITNQYGFFAEGSITDATNNFGFYSNIASASQRWNFYAAGTAANYFAGNCFIGATTGDQALNVNGAVRVANITTANQTSAGTMDFTGGNMRFLVWGSSGVQGNFTFWTAPGGSGATQRMTLDGSGNLGLATSTFGTSATNTFAVFTGTAPTTGPADSVQFYSTDLSAGNTIPSFYTEGTNVGTGTPAANRTIAVRFNGTVYYLLASTIP